MCNFGFRGFVASGIKFALPSGHFPALHTEDGNCNAPRNVGATSVDDPAKNESTLDAGSEALE
jgi:hypothetical protein